MLKAQLAQPLHVLIGHANVFSAETSVLWIRHSFPVGCPFTAVP